MSKLFHLKEWLTIADAARHLSIVFGEEVTEADVLQLALGGHLELSVYLFETVIGFPVTIVVERDSKRNGVVLNDGSFCQYEAWDDEDVPPFLDGLVTLVMKGNAVTAVERRYRAMIGLPSIHGTDTDSFEKALEENILLFAKGDDLYAIEDTHGDILPRGASLVVRNDALREFENAISGRPASVDKPLTTTERNTLLIIIAALCDYSAIKHQERGAATQIAKLTEEIGATVTDDTVRKALAIVPDALEARKK